VQMNGTGRLRGHDRRVGRNGRNGQAMAALRSFRVIYGSVRQHFRSVERRCGVSGSQLWILQEVARAPGIGISDLAARISIHQSTCSLLVEKLVKAKLVARTRISSDQRRVGLKLTRRGQRTVSGAPGPAEGVLPQALEELSNESLKALNRSLRLVIDRLDLHVDGAADRPLSDL
jgi:DNA-binding MarR family transcriptional regulator